MKNLIIAPTLFCALSSTLFAENYYNLDNWYAVRNGGKPALSSDGNSVQISTLAYDALVFCYINPIQIATGTTITVSGTIGLSGISGNSSANTVVGIFDSKNASQTNVNAKLPETDGIPDHGVNSKDHSSEYGSSELTYEMAGFLTSVKTAYNRNNPTNSSSCIATNSGGTKIVDYASEFSSPIQDTDYNFLITITQTAANTFSGSFSLNDETAYSFENQTNNISKIDVIAFKLPTTSSVVTFKNFSVIPEPSIFGIFAGLAAMTLVAGTRKRRK